ncbi:MAG: hypothetical protein LCH32_11165 [Bacteroidetes bacterium]|nr:hypothetical protein [Bacteroidota bacterium]
MDRLKYILIFGVIFTFKIGAQSFEKNSLVIHSNFGLEIYNTTYNYKTKNTNYAASATETDRAASKNINVGAEYGLHKLFGVGINFKNNNFFTSKDTATNITPTANSFDISAVASLHAITAKKFDLLIGGEFGYSKLTYKANDPTNLILKGDGTYSSIFLSPRIYFGDFGINFKFYAPFVNYTKMKTNNEDYNYYVISKWKGSPGFGFSFGIQYKIDLGK